MSVDKQTARKLCMANRFSFLLPGFAVAAWAPMIPFVKDRFALGEDSLGLLLFCVALGSFVSMPLAGTLSSRLGCKFLIYTGTIATAIFLPLIAIMPNIYALALVLFFFGMASVTLDVVSNINAAKVESIVEKPIMSGLHGLYSVGGFLGSVIVTLLVSSSLGLFASALIAAALILITCFLGCKDLLTSIVEEQAEDTKISKFPHPIVILVGILCFIMFMTEGGMLDWSGVYLKEVCHIKIEYAGFGYSAFAIAMTIFRLTGDKIIETFGRLRVIILGSICIFLGFLLTVVTQNTIGALCGFALIGVGASNLVPQFISYIAQRKEMPMHLSVTWVNAIGFTGILSGPAIIGFTSSLITMPWTFMLLGIMVLIVGVISYFLMRKK